MPLGFGDDPSSYGVGLAIRSPIEAAPGDVQIARCLSTIIPARR